MRVFVVAGETSGDTHAAALFSELKSMRPDLQISGLGGPKLHAMNPDVEDWTHDAAVIGLWDVLRRYGWFRKKFDEAVRRIEKEKPDAVLFVDYPGFNLRLAKALQPLRPGTKLLYYISPQVWAWNRARIPRMARWLDRMFCIFPFEKDLYEESGLHADFVGHPMAAHLDEVGEDARDPNLLALLPGSREREVRKIFPLMLGAAREVAAKRPATRFAAAAMSEHIRTMMQSMAAAHRIEVAIGMRNSREIMQTAAAGLVASGTATLEATLVGLPYALVYKVAWITYIAGRFVIKVPHLGMANLLAGKEIIREFIQTAATPSTLASEALQLLEDARYRSAMRENFGAVRRKLVAPGSVSPGRAVLEVLD